MRFHAKPPAGEWLNDPNALLWDGETWRLLAQHRFRPDERVTGMGALVSPDLLKWRWSGVAVAGEATRWAYSGSATRVPEDIELFHTEHDAERNMQHQVRRRLDGASAGDPLPLGDTLARPGRNRRDPFVFRMEESWGLLLAEPCDWHAWRTEPPSQLGLFRSDDREHWRRAATIGPWSPPGMLWEVPVLLRSEDHDLLMISTVDRREGGADCAVRGWIGAIGEDGFTPLAGEPAGGRLVDLGPDFYAAMPATDRHPADADRLCVAWLASWATAREPVWPGFAGGPITLPRRIAVIDEAGRLRIVNRPLPIPSGRFAPADCLPPSGLGRAAWPGEAPFILHLRGDGSEATFTGDPATARLSVRRDGPPVFAWQADHPTVLEPCRERTIALFVDGPAVELFVEPEAFSVTMTLPGGVRAAELLVDGAAAPIAWSVYRDPSD